MSDPLKQARAQRNWRDAKARKREVTKTPEKSGDQLDDARRDEEEKRRKMFDADSRPLPEAEDTSG